MQERLSRSAYFSAALFALAPITLVISHPSVGIVFLVCALPALTIPASGRGIIPAVARPLPATALLFGFIGLLSALWAADPPLALSKSAVFLAAVFLAVALAGVLLRLDDQARSRIATALIGGFGVAAVLLGIQIWGDFLFKDFVLDTSYTAKIANVKLNVASAGMVIMLWAVMGALVSRCSRPLARAVVVVGAAGGMAAVVFAGTGSAPILALVLGLGALGSGWRWPRTTAVMLGLGICAFSIFLLFGATRLYQSEGFADSRWLDRSAKTRVDIWDTAARLAWQKPVLGHGVGSSKSFPPSAEISKVTRKPRVIPLYPHNVLLQTMLELGLTGLLSAWAFFAALLHAALRLAPATRPFAFAAFTSALTVWLVGYPLWRSAWLCWLAICALSFLVLERRPAVPGGAS